MTTMDKAAIGWSIAIVAIGVAIAFGSQNIQDVTLGVDIPEPPAPVDEAAKRTIEKEESGAQMTDPFADIAAKVKAGEPTESGMTTEMTSEKSMPEQTGSKTVNVSIPTGTLVQGCEETNECYIPASVTVNAGDTVAWTNDDTAAHTVSAGTPVNGPSEEFDSSLLMAGATFEHTFNDAGNYDYYCMVHPWMVGTVQVN